MIKVSVCMITYNQEEFIAQAIESVLMQRTDFIIEIVIAEDCSTDATRGIIKNFEKKYPNIIKPIYQEFNVGAGKNSVDCLKACTGDYVALLEGDDYWIDPYKLQKQVSFLEQNPEYSICFNRVYEEYKSKRTLSPDNPWDEEKTFTIDDLAKKNFMHTPSVLFRNNLIEEFPKWFSKSPVGDYVLHMLNAKKGLIKYYPEPMAVYRKYTGTWSSKPMTSQISKFMEVLDYLIAEDFKESVIDTMRLQKQNLLNNYCKILLDRNDFSFLNKMEEGLRGESELVANWMLNIYPNKIQQLTNSRSFKFIMFLSKLKEKFINLFN